eukprot:SAG31_NODE_135_length_23206_cov_25.707967_20_plen_87_part_00
MITVPAAQQIPDVYGIFTCVVNTFTLPVARPPASEAAPCLSCAAAAQVPPNLPQHDLELRCASRTVRDVEKLQGRPKVANIYTLSL